MSSYGVEELGHGDAGSHVDGVGVVAEEEWALNRTGGSGRRF